MGIDHQEEVKSLILDGMLPVRICHPYQTPNWQIWFNPGQNFDAYITCRSENNRLIIRLFLSGLLMLSFYEIPAILLQKKTHWRGYTALQQPNIYIDDILFLCLRLGAKFDNCRIVQNILGPLALASDPFFFGGVSREHTIQISDRHPPLG